MSEHKTTRERAKYSIFGADRDVLDRVMLRSQTGCPPLALGEKRALTVTESDGVIYMGPVPTSGWYHLEVTVKASGITATIKGVANAG